MGHQFLRLGGIVRTAGARGEVSEWFKEPVLKTGDSVRGRGFESHPLRHNTVILGEVLKRLKRTVC